MEEYKPNSHKSKEQPEKRVEKPVVSSARRKKKSELKRLSDIFISEDIHNVKSYIFLDVLIPAIKKAIWDIITNGADMLLYGETGRSKKNGTASKISYRDFYEKGEKESGKKYRGSPGYSYGDVEVDSRREAEAIINSLNDLIEVYQVASVADLYDLANLEHEFTDNKYGWSNIRGASIVRTRTGYLIKMPKCMPIDG